MSRIDEIARLVKTEPEMKRSQAELSTRPLRYAFVIREDIEPGHLAQILEYNSAVWGGYYSCMVPTDGQTIEESWRNNLYLYRPDKVVFCGDKGSSVVTDELVETVWGELQPFSLRKWVEWDKSKDLAKIHQEGRSDGLLDVTPLIYPLLHWAESLRSPIEEGQSRARIPTIDEEHPL